MAQHPHAAHAKYPLAGGNAFPLRRTTAWPTLLPPESLTATILAERGFGDVKLFEVLSVLGFQQVIRFRAKTRVRAVDGETREAGDWVVKLYSKRWTIEPSFRDSKDLRFGMGMGTPRIDDRNAAIASCCSTPSPSCCRRYWAPLTKASAWTGG